VSIGQAGPAGTAGCVGQPEQVGDAHRVQHAARRGLRGAQVGVPVEVDQRGAGIVPLQASQHAQRYRAVAAEHDRQPLPGQCHGHRVRDAAGHLDHGGQVARGGIGRVRGEHHPGHVAEVGHIQAGLPELADEAGRTQRGGRPVLARVMRSGAGGHAEHGDFPVRHRGLLPLGLSAY
jgi:hypothetical protein